MTNDHEAELETFCRLQRLGSFSTAHDYFEDNLEPYLSNPYVFVQFGQLLLDQGDYFAFERLNPEAVFDKEDPHRRTSRFREGIKVVGGNRSRSRVRSRFEIGSQSQSPFRERQSRARSRSQGPVASDRPVRRARFENSDERLVRIYNIPKSPSFDSIRDHDGSGQHNDNIHNHSPAGEPRLHEVETKVAYNELELLRHNWRLLKATSTIHSKRNFKDTFNEA